MWKRTFSALLDFAPDDQTKAIQLAGFLLSLLISVYVCDLLASILSSALDESSCSIPPFISWARSFRITNYYELDLHIIFLDFPS